MNLGLNLSRPRDITFIISAVIAILTLLGQLVALPVFTAYAFGLLVIAYLILAAGVLVHNL